MSAWQNLEKLPKEIFIKFLISLLKTLLFFLPDMVDMVGKLREGEGWAQNSMGDQARIST